MADRLVVVAAHLLGRSQTAPPHDEQQGARDLLGRGPQPVERRALCLAEPGATAQAAVALMSAHMAIAHDMRLLAVAIGARRTGSRWTHRVAPPTLPSSNSYASPVTTQRAYLRVFPISHCLCLRALPTSVERPSVPTCRRL